MATELSNNLGVNISKEEEDGTVYMVIDDTDYETALDEIADIIYAESDVEDLGEIRPIIQDCIIEDEPITEAFKYEEEIDYDFPPYDDEETDLGDEMDYDDYPPYDDDDERTVYLSFDECDGDECDELTEDEEFEDEEFDDDDALNDCGGSDKFDECNKMEDEEFECYESKKYRYKGNGIYESKKGCCPKRKSPRRMKKMVNLSEAL